MIYMVSQTIMEIWEMVIIQLNVLIKHHKIGGYLMIKVLL